jgi:hypothetical protein
MSKVLGGILSVVLGLILGTAGAAAAPADQITKDARGRVISRMKQNADGSSHRTSIEYGSDSEKPALVVDEDLDPRNRPTRRVEQRFDDQGRLRAKLEVTIDAAGKERGTRTRYWYDPSGQRFDEATPVN